MGFLLQSNFLFLLLLVILGSLLNSWGGLSKGRSAGSIAGTGLFLQLGCIIAAFLFIGWYGSIAVILNILIFWPICGYLAASAWVKMHPQAKLLTPSLASHLCGLPPESRNYEAEDEKAKFIIDEVTRNPGFKTIFDEFHVPMSEAEEIHNQLGIVCGPKTADTVLSKSNLLLAYLQYYSRASENKHREASYQVASDLNFPKV